MMMSNAAFVVGAARRWLSAQNHFTRRKIPLEENLEDDLLRLGCFPAWRKDFSTELLKNVWKNRLSFRVTAWF
jgi:hypothetical protein